MTRVLRIGTRSSALALAQSTLTVELLARHGVAARLVPLTSPGDADSRPLPGRGHEGIFVSSVRDALLDGLVDVALHSFKDVPTTPAPGITVAAVPMRADPRDTVVSSFGPLAALPAGAVIGTCSVRRAAWVHRVRPDLVVAPIRGPIDARVERVRAGEYDAIILAAAGLDRLGRSADIAEVIPSTSLVPAPAQGALALECRSGDADARLLLQRVDHSPTHRSAVAERAVLDAIDPTDRTAVGALASMRSGTLVIVADLSEPDGSARVVSGTSGRVSTVAEAHSIGVRLAETLTERARSLTPLARAS
jgi:hydroxymethylbilane synthase